MSKIKSIHISRKLHNYLCWPFLVGGVVTAAAAAAFAFDRRQAILLCLTALVVDIICLTVYLSYRKHILRELAAFGSEYAQVQRQILKGLAIPYVLVDENGHIIWKNTAFDEAFSGNPRSLFQMFPENVKEMMPVRESKTVNHVTFGDRRYRIEAGKAPLAGTREAEELTGDSDALIYAVYLFDETEIMNLEQAIEEEKLVVGMIYLDNYDEALESIEEVRRSLLVALIDRKINKYFSVMGGIVKKIEKDKYFLVLPYKCFKEMGDAKYPLLEEVKTVSIGNEMSVTISMGLGINGQTYLESYEFARTAIDMALGRGGDQVVIKDQEQITYFGGKTQTTGKNTRVKARVKAQALRELIETKDRVLIMGHQLADVDAIGAAVGIYRAARFSEKKANIVVENATRSVNPLIERFRENADYDRDMFISHQTAMELLDSNTVLVVVDVNRPSYTEFPALLEHASHIVVIDHHRQTREVVKNAVLSYVEPYASSACEMVAEILQYYGNHIRIRPLDADAMYAGIVVDTNNFLNKTGIRTFEAAAFLRRNGADVTRVRKLFRDNIEDYMAKADAVRNAELIEDVFAISYCGKGTYESPTVIGAQAANELLGIRGVKASFVLSELGGKIYISARSIDEVNVQIIMEKLGGGGHMTVAGAQLTDTTIPEAKEKLIAVIREMKESGEI